MKIKYAKFHQHIRVGSDYISHATEDKYQMEWNGVELTVDSGNNDLLIVLSGNIEHMIAAKPAASDAIMAPRRGRPPKNVENG